MSRVFTSYRRADSALWATKLSAHLGLRYGKDLIFQDVEDIKAGDNWLETIRHELEVCQVFLIVIGRHWLVDEEGYKRLFDPEDILRLEIEEALSGQGTVIPVLVDGASMPGEDDLPDSLQALTLRQAKTLRDTYWAADVEALIERLSELILPTAEQVPLHTAKQDLYQKQLLYFELLDKNNAEALELAQKTQEHLDRILPLYPQDPWLKVTRGYLFKNEAMALLRLRRIDEADRALNEGELIFRTMIVELPEDESAWNGLGSIEAVRGNYDEALTYIDRALEINPHYEEALRDHERIEKAKAAALARQA